jgi:magnesium transporter
MLLKYPAQSGGPGEGAPLWIDLLDPSENERLDVERWTGFSVPTLDVLSEIESSSRLRVRDGVLMMSTPMIGGSDASTRAFAPIGFVLSRDTLVTVRFSAVKAFDAVAGRCISGDDHPTCSLDVFTLLSEEMVDRLADSLEATAGALNDLSGTVFSIEDVQGRQVVRASNRFRDQLQLVGQIGARTSNTRDALLGLARILTYVGDLTRPWGLTAIEPRLATVRQDVQSLSDYELHLSDKVQFLLDALVGMIGIAQNDIFKILTIVSIVGIPPTLVASIYGMNFKLMPELNWALGYPFGLAMIAISAVIPAAWFKYRGWF